MIWLTKASSAAQGLSECNKCGDCCRFPCALLPEDVARIADRVESFEVSVTEKGGAFYVSPVKDGEFCSLYDNGCSVHDIKPAGGRDFECWNEERTAPGRERRFAWTKEQIMELA